MISKAKIAKVNLCSFQGCPNYAKCKGLCNAHYLQAWSGKPLKPIKATKKRRPKTCIFPGCDKPHCVGGLCNAHQMQKRRGKPLVPLGWFEPSPIEIKEEHAEVILFNKDGVETGRAVINVADIDLVKDHKWFLSPSGYATAHRGVVDGHDRTIFMHRMIIGTPEGMETDHKDGDRLNNRRSNLRFATDSQNCQNVVRPGRAMLRNVYFSSRPRDHRKPWRVTIQFNKKPYYGGTFATKEEALGAARALRAKLFTHHNEARHV